MTIENYCYQGRSNGVDKLWFNRLFEKRLQFGKGRPGLIEPGGKRREAQITRLDRSLETKFRDFIRIGELA